jgi:hydrogenase expression/formation protein HypD
MVYSTLDALAIARDNPGRQVVFMGIGFETTTPASAMAILTARREGLANFSLFCNHVLTPRPSPTCWRRRASVRRRRCGSTAFWGRAMSRP